MEINITVDRIAILRCATLAELTHLVPSVANADVETELERHIARVVTPACESDEQYSEEHREQWVLAALQEYALEQL